MQEQLREPPRDEVINQGTQSLQPIAIPTHSRAQETIHETPEVLHQVKTNEFQNPPSPLVTAPPAAPCAAQRVRRKVRKARKVSSKNSSPMVDAVKNATVPKEFAELEPNLHSPPNAIAQSLENFASRQDAALTKLSHQARADSSIRDASRQQVNRREHVLPTTPIPEHSLSAIKGKRLLIPQLNSPS